MYMSDSDMDFLFFVFILILGISIWIGWKFGEVANSKGYDEGFWKPICILFGVPAWLLVIALPNKRQHEELLAALRQNSNVKEQAATVSNELPEL